MKKILYTIISFLILSQFVSAQEIYTVIKTTDPDPYIYEYNDVDSLCDPVMYGTLQWAVRKSNSNNGNCIINFNIPGGGTQTITLKYFLPQMQGNNILIDGTSQAGFSHFSPTIIIDGNQKIKECFNFIKSSNIEVKGLYFKNFITSAIVASDISTNLKITDNVINIAYNNGSSEQIGISCQYCNIGEIYGNIIGSDVNNVSNGTINNGILLSNSSNKFIVGDTIYNKRNIIKNCNNGIYILKSKYNKISGNSIFDNNIKGIELADAGNNNKNAPVIVSLDSITHILEGNSDPNDIIEIFGSTGSQNANNYITTTLADANGYWQAFIDTSSQYLIATATDANGNTSEFSDVINGVRCAQHEEPYIVLGYDTIWYQDSTTFIFNGSTTLPDTINMCDNQEICFNILPYINMWGDTVRECTASTYDINFNGCHPNEYNVSMLSYSYCFTPNPVSGVYLIEFHSNVCGCSYNFWINIIPTPDPTIYTNPNPPIICQGETIDLTVQPSSPPLTYTYNWSNGVTTYNNDNLSPNANTWYYVTVANQSCEAYDSVEVIVKPSPVIDSIISTSTCVNPACSGTATVYASSGAPFSYQWDNNAGAQTTQTATNLCVGTYNVTVTNDYSCSSTGNVTIDTLPRFFLQISTQNTSCRFACDGEATISVIAPAGIVPNLQYELSNGSTAYGILPQTFTNLCTGNYSVTVTDGNGCESYGSFNIGYNNGTTAVPHFDIDSSSCWTVNDTINFTITNYDSTNTYTWNFDGTQQTSTSQTISHVYTEHGYHCINVTANGPCGQSLIASSKVIYVSSEYCCNDTTINFTYSNGVTISQNTIWNQNNFGTNTIYINGDVIIEPGATLTIAGTGNNNFNVRFTEKSRIIVKQRGQLWVEYSYLSSLKDSMCMWQGIEVWGNTNQPPTPNYQGMATITKHSTIKNAYVAVMVGARNLSVICPNGTNNKYYLFRSGGIVRASQSFFINNGKSIVYVERQTQSRNLQGYPISSNTFDASSMIDNYYKLSSPTHYPNNLNVWAGNANNLGRGDIGIETDEVKNLVIRANDFYNMEYGVKSSDANLRLYNDTLDNLTQGIFVRNTYTSLNNYNDIIGNKFINIPNYQTANDRGHMIHLENSYNDLVHNNNTFGDNLLPNQNNNGVGVYCINSAGYRIGENNKFNVIRYGIIARNSGNVGGWIGPFNGEPNTNYFRRVYASVITQFQNQKLTIRCNDFEPYYGSAYYSGNNIYTTGILADQGNNPANYGLINRDRVLAGNKFDNSNNKEINCYGFSPGYDYWAHNQPEFMPTTSCPNIHIHQTPYYFNPNTSCKDLVTIHPIPLTNYKNASDSLLGVIQQKTVERDNLIASLDNGNTQYLLNLINNNTNPVTLLIELYNNSPLSDTVLISLLVRERNIPAPFLTLIMSKNTPVTKKVEPYFYNKVNNMHGYFKYILLQLQGNNPFTTTVRDYNRLINNLDIWRNNIVNKAIIAYLDSANYNKDSAISYVSRENNFAYKQVLFDTYLQDSLLANAHTVLNNMQAQNPDDIEWKTLNTLLLNLKDSGKTVFDLDSTDIYYIENLANNCEGGIATSQARAIWEKLTGERIICGVDLPPQERNMQDNNANNNYNDDDIISETDNIILGNNYPDPCDEQTTIPYLLPDGFNGIIVIYNIKGEIIGSYKLNKGSKELIVNTKNIKSGIYIYNMFLNNIKTGTGKINVVH